MDDDDNDDDNNNNSKIILILIINLKTIYTIPKKQTITHTTSQ